MFVIDVRFLLRWLNLYLNDQVAMGGVSKYLICGHRATQNAVQNLFQSVQLNINNPNFLIMQGKITKVLNMKPPEILGMIEEAAGTSMFEDKKDKAVKTMAKKEKKIEEIQAVSSVYFLLSESLQLTKSRALTALERGDYSQIEQIARRETDISRVSESSKRVRAVISFSRSARMAGSQVEVSQFGTSMFPETQLIRYCHVYL